MRIVLIEYTHVYKTTSGVMKMTSAFLARSTITTLAANINLILLSYIILSPSTNQYKYWQNLVYLVVSRSAMGYRFLLLSGIPMKYNNHQPSNKSMTCNRLLK